MRFLDAELRPVPVAGALPPLVTAAAISVVTALMTLAIGRDPAIAVPLFPAVFIGALLAQAGVSPQRTPKAMLASLPVVGLLMVGASEVTALLGG